jgi:hypothetical protein
MNPVTNRPCLDFDPSAPGLTMEQKEAYRKYQNLMRNGYPTDILLSQAVKEFNACFSSVGEPPLTENEVLAVMLQGPDLPATWEEPEAVQADLEKILLRKLLPKGARFEVLQTTELNLAGDDSAVLRAAFKVSRIKIKRWVIVLYRGVDRRPLEDRPLAPGQAFVIRQRYHGLG